MPYRSSSSPADIGLSKSEYEDAVNLEKLYFLVNKSDRCANCGRGGVSAVDVSRYEFLCSSCCAGKSSVKRIGEDRFSSFEVNKLYARFDRSNAHRGRSSTSFSRSGTSGSGGARRSDRRVERRSGHRPPVPDLSEGSESDSGDDSPLPPRRSRSMPRASGRSPRQYRSSSHRGDPFDTFEVASNASWGGQGGNQGDTQAASWGAGFPSSAGVAARAHPQVGGGMGTSPAGMLGLTPSPAQAPFGQSFQFPGMVGMGSPVFLGASQGAPSSQAWVGQPFLTPQQYQQAMMRQFAGSTGPAGRDGSAFPGSMPVPQPPNMVGQTPNFMPGAAGAGGLRAASPLSFPGTATQQPGQRGMNPFLAMGTAPQPVGQPAPSPFASCLPGMGGATMNPFLSVQKPATGGGGFADAGVFGASGLGFAPQQPPHMRPPAGGMMSLGSGTPGGTPNPFTSMGMAAPQRPMTLTNAARPGGGAGGNPYNTSLW
ncbi:putative major ampullate spidroin 2 [Neospora caninum Liverpool]|uniref:Major ampullate spidroin 2, putative n=1 Tax=Neospora caninum (strain Liverpool) TaxID=572307 RepID=F0VHK6_NEOCL|nr:putative major ampullate spidroin 2 [Neospora caninum Liverpool]CBZ53200.1 putative major ampullate spidroin 2 [Neospora caninum Liverpool]CEL67190.1 TPA: major ampullate spidroin 2, putative [Neospora caninum Liverpool]|eukprot:XP_003883232.1 putative major ampullate spidroin 2 [Neospora caninum Liverpool]